jgi:L-ascorbate metabolism protein UlaG (beta-lactamase superfamily)
MPPDDALRAVKLLQPKRVLPIHYNTWEVIAQDPAAWAVRVRQETKAEPVVLKPGDWLTVG